MISLRKELIEGKSQREGFFKSYRAIGEYLAEHGETGTYWAIPRNIKSIAGMKEIKVTEYYDEVEGLQREIVMEGSYF